MRRRLAAPMFALALGISSMGCTTDDGAQHLRNADVGAAVKVPAS